ncbi:MAG TPA: IS481 family transposase [Gemmatimonadaceae bacterium]|nr:IS481 family transposase [Gemmatimonadaceae bacterium]
MNSHKNARLGFTGRVCLVTRVLEDGWAVPEAAAAFAISAQSVRKWMRRYRAEGLDGLRDRSSRPHRSPRQLPAAVERRIRLLRARRRSGPQIADALHLPLSTVGDVLRRVGLGRLPPVVPRPPIVRYERATPGELLHIDAKKLGRIGCVGHRIHGDYTRRARGGGWECLHVAIDDASRVAYAELFPDESAESATAFLKHAVAWLATLGVRVTAVMTDNAFCYVHRRYATTLGALGLRHLRIRPYTPRTNGKAERFIQTALREWAYARPYRSSAARAGALGAFLTCYNTTRPHTAHGRKPPISRLSA